jgi:Ca2+-binding RTX toxin-like protein
MRSYATSSAVIETLETRRLLSASAAVVVGDVLRVHPTPAGTDHTVTITETADGNVNVDFTSKAKRPGGEDKHYTASFAKTLGFTRVHVIGGPKTDFITFVGVDNLTAFSMPVRVNALAGNDQITTGSGDDVIRGGLGSDSIHAGAGNDLLRGNQGNDDLFGEDGDDVIWGGMGDDMVNGGAGNDQLGGIVGHNSLIGGDGNDTFVVQSIEANPDNDYTEASDILMIVTKKTDDNAAGPAV